MCALPGYTILKIEAVTCFVQPCGYLQGWKIQSLDTLNCKVKLYKFKNQSVRVYYVHNSDYKSP